MRVQSLYLVMLCLVTMWTIQAFNIHKTKPLHWLHYCGNLPSMHACRTCCTASWAWPILYKDIHVVVHGCWTNFLLSPSLKSCRANQITQGTHDYDRRNDSETLATFALRKCCDDSLQLNWLLLWLLPWSCTCPRQPESKYVWKIGPFTTRVQYKPGQTTIQHGTVGERSSM